MTAAPPLDIPAEALDAQAQPAGFVAFALSGLAAALAVILPFLPTASEIAGIWWRSQTFAHGLVVLPISLWLIWRLRARLGALALRPALFPLVPLALSGAAWAVGEMASVAALSHLSLVAMIVSSIWAVWGHAAFRLCFFPLCFLFFGAPFGEFLVPSLMQHTADFTVAALRATGVPVFREGLQFVIPSGRWSVVEACSGMRYLIASVMVGALFAYLNYRSAWRRFAFVVASVLTPLVANWLRAYIIVMLGHLSGNRLATGVDHIIYGWVFFGIVIMALFWVGSFWREDNDEQADEPVLMHPREARAIAGRAVPALLMVLVLAGLWRPLERWIENVPGAYSYVLQAPAPAAGWDLEGEAPVAGWQPSYVGERARLVRTYAKGGQRVTLFIAFYARQHDGAELIQWGNRLLFPEDKQWSQLDEVSDSLAGVPARGALIFGRGGRLGAWTWYWLGGEHAVDARTAKLSLAADRLMRRPDDSAAVVVWAETGDSLREAHAAVSDFVKDHHAAIETVLAHAPHP
ncbi:exosortase A [Niveibacterium sp. SC-1]|uniref:exosortase A n=1 Tax=Niveibacterium sp. SC-1 TaxID=3135646 RepID=UPI00311E2064